MDQKVIYFEKRVEHLNVMFQSISMKHLVLYYLIMYTVCVIFDH